MSRHFHHTSCKEIIENIISKVNKIMHFSERDWAQISLKWKKKVSEKAALSFFITFSFHKKIIVVLLWIALIGTYSVNLSLYEMEIKIRMKMEIKIRRIFVPLWLLNTWYENLNDLFHIHVQRKKNLCNREEEKKIDYFSKPCECISNGIQSFFLHRFQFLWFRLEKSID